MRLRRLPFCLVLGLTPLCAAQELTEREAMQRFIQSSPRLQAWDAEVRAKRAEWRGLTFFPNASLSLSQEDSGGVRDQFITLSQPLPVSGRLGLLRNAGRAGTTATEAGIARRRQIALADFRRVFASLAVAQERVTVLRRHVNRLQELLRILREREKEGEGAGFDVLRSERELADAEADWKLAGVELERKRYELIGMMHGNASSDLRASSDAGFTSDAEPADALFRTALRRRPDLKALQAQIQSFSLQQQAAGRQWLPDVTVSGGSKRTSAAGISDTGYSAGVNFTLPFFNHGQADVTRFRAEQARGNAELALLQRQIEAEVLSAHAAATAAGTLAAQFAEAQLPKARELLKIADLSYQEGERSILELLDAYRIVAGSELRVLELRSIAKEALIELDLASGAEVLP